MDFSVITSFIGPAIVLVVSGLTAVAAIKITPYVYRWGYNRVITWFGHDELGQIIEEGDRDKYMQYKARLDREHKAKKIRQKRDDEDYERYKEKRRSNERHRRRYDDEDEDD